MQPVTQLDKDNTHVLGHRKQHFPQTFHVRFFFVLNIQVNKLCQTVYQERNLTAKPFPDFLQIGLVGAILHRIMQKRSTNGIGIQTQSRNNLRHRNRVGNIRLPARAELPFMHFGSVRIRIVYFFNIVMIPRSRQHLQQPRDIRMYFHSHTLTPFLCFRIHTLPPQCLQNCGILQINFFAVLFRNFKQINAVSDLLNSAKLHFIQNT